MTVFGQLSVAEFKSPKKLFCFFLTSFYSGWKKFEKVLFSSQRSNAKVKLKKEGLIRNFFEGTCQLYSGLFFDVTCQSVSC